jgi:RNA polymerase sigma-70 factor (ECF subfamily)
MNSTLSEASNVRHEKEPSKSDVADLVRRAQEGDEEAFGEIVMMFQQRVYSVAYRFVQNADEAQDLAQQAWIKAWSRLKGFKGKSGFFTWMYRVVSSVCLDYLRKKKRLAEQQLLDGMEPARDSGAELAASVTSRPDHELERLEIRKQFAEALNTLSPEHRMALMMREVDGCSYDEIAKVMKCRKGTVMSRIYYARKNIQEQLKELR